jgi:putative DNA primase/helicase
MTGTANKTIADAAVDYASRRGWKPVPVSRQSKKPIGKGWQKRPFAPAQFNGNAQNIALQLGDVSGGLCDVDLDCIDAIGLAPELLPATGAIFGRRSKPCSHQLYISDLCKTEQKAVIAFNRCVGGKLGPVLVELRIGVNGKSATSVVPPSMHVTGEMVEWVSEGEPAHVAGADLKHSVLELAVAALLKGDYPGQGVRQQGALVIGGVLARAGWDAEQIQRLVHVVAHAAGDDEVAKRVEAAVGAIARKDKGEDLPGLPRLAEVWGKDVADTLARWLKYRHEDASPSPLPPAYDRPPEFSDDALALRFAELHAKDLRYVAEWGRWLRYDGMRWQFDDTLVAFDRARVICRAAAAECNSLKLAKGLASAKTVAAVERLARCDRRLAATVDQWDADPWLLNTPRGVIDLRTCEMRAHHADDYLTHMTAVAPEGECPRWHKFLEEITDKDKGLQDYLQRVSGYALTGVTTEHALFFYFGKGANGKTTFMTAVTGVLADYHRTAPIETFAAAHVDRHPTELADLRGARLVTANETEEGRRWAESRINMLTGGERVSARFMRQDLFSFVPQLKLMISGNHKPSLRSVNEAARRRFNLIPFTVTIPVEERDKELGDKLRTEWPGILQWMLDGCVDWQERGLAPPEIVTAATTAYLDAQDTVAAWLDECCELNANVWERSQTLFASWKAFAERSGHFVGDTKTFRDRLEGRNGITHRLEPGTKRAGYQGVRLKMLGHPSEDPYHTH